MAVDDGKESKLGFEIYPIPTINNCVVEPYNVLLVIPGLLDYMEMSLYNVGQWSNSIYGLCHQKFQ